MLTPSPRTGAPHPRVRVAAIVVRDDAILVVQHEKGGRRYWLLPGGGVDYGETLVDAVVREVKEETGLGVRVGQLVLANDTIPPDRHRHIVNLCFRAELEGGELRPGRDHRLIEARFVPVDKLVELDLYPDIRAELLAGIRDGFGHAPRYLGNLWKDQ